jgi:NADH-quinone oxidoreductase subunit E
VTGFDPEVRARLELDAKEIIARYPRSRSALLPLLHLVQSEEGYVSPHGIELCAELLDISTAEVAGVVTFYTMYKRRPSGQYAVGVCTNTLCAVLGGDQIFRTLKDHLGVGHDETTEDGVVTLEHLECNAACDYAPVMMVNWEFFDNQTPESATRLVDDLREGKAVRPTRGAPLRTFTEVSRVLAGFPDGLADEGGSAGPATLVGLETARERGDSAPEARRQQAPEAPKREPAADQVAAGGSGAAQSTEGAGYGKAGGPSGSDPESTSHSDPAAEKTEAAVPGTETATDEPAEPAEPAKRGRRKGKRS